MYSAVDGPMTTTIERMSRLLAETPMPWRAIHVATVHDTTTVCNLISANFDYYNRSRVLQLTRLPELSWGKFTQHTIDRWDGISINNQAISKATFEQLETKFKAIGEQIGASRSEVMTAIAFQAFTDAKVDVGVVETMRTTGDEEPTSIIGVPSGSLTRAVPICTAPLVLGWMEPGSSWSMDGPQLLAKQSRIFMANVPIISVRMETREGFKLLEKHAHEAGTTLITRQSLFEQLKVPNLESNLWFHYEDWMHTWPSAFPAAWQSAFMATLYTLMHLDRLSRPGDVRADKFDYYLGLLLCNFESVWEWADDPGATQVLHVELSTSCCVRICLVPDSQQMEHRLTDVQMVRKLGVNRNEHMPLIWLFATEEGYKFPCDLRHHIRPSDVIITTSFAEVDGQPSLKSTPAQDLLRMIKREIGHETDTMIYAGTIHEAMQEALRLAGERNVPIIAIGSRWLISDILRLVQNGVIIRSTSYMDDVEIERGYFESYWNEETTQEEG